MDEEHAAIEAENSMGDRNAVRAQLEQVHASFPELDFKKALTLVTVGFVFMSFMLEVSYPLLKEVRTVSISLGNIEARDIPHGQADVIVCEPLWEM